MALRAGDWVEVRSKEEILRTLDKQGRLDNMPFMPEMFAYCGKCLPVYKRAHKACDTINPVSKRRLTDTVLLGNIRCNGSAHGGCEAQCSVFWKEAWLKPIPAPGSKAPSEVASQPVTSRGCTEEDVTRATRLENPPFDEIHYRCQATDFPLFSAPINSRSLDLYVEDYTSGNVSLKELFQTSSYFLFKAVSRLRAEDDGGIWSKLYDRFQRLWGGLPYPRRRGKLKKGDKHPLVSLNLQPGELVRVKSYEEILATIDEGNRNRGLFFDAEQLPYCGGVYRVRSRVERFLDEKTGVMLTMKTPAVILDGGWCRSYYSEHRAFCPRAIYGWWREAWLERAPEGSVPSTTCPRTRAALGIRSAEEVEG